MFRISRRLDYGMQLMIALAQETENAAQPTAQLAEKLQIPLPFLHQIGHTLMQAGLIKASPGPRGGLRLNQNAEDITILKIAETLEGPICINACLGCEEECPRQDECSAKLLWEEVQQKVIDVLSTTTLESLAAKQTKISKINLNLPEQGHSNINLN